MNYPRVVNRFLLWFVLSITLAPITGPVAAAVVNSTWVGGVGNWHDASNWDPSIIPGNGSDTYRVSIANSGDIVRLASNASVDNLFIGDGAKLNIDETSLEVEGHDQLQSHTITLEGGGAIQLRGSEDFSTLAVSGTVELIGTGEIRFDGNPDHNIRGLSPTPRLVVTGDATVITLTSTSANTVPGGTFGQFMEVHINAGELRVDKLDPLHFDFSGDGDHNNETAGIVILAGGRAQMTGSLTQPGIVPSVDVFGRLELGCPSSFAFDGGSFNVFTDGTLAACHVSYRKDGAAAPRFLSEASFVIELDSGAGTFDLYGDIVDDFALQFSGGSGIVGVNAPISISRSLTLSSDGAGDYRLGPSDFTGIREVLITSAGKLVFDGGSFTVDRAAGDLINGGTLRVQGGSTRVTTHPEIINDGLIAAIDNAELILETTSPDESISNTEFGRIEAENGARVVVDGVVEGGTIDGISGTIVGAGRLRNAKLMRNFEIANSTLILDGTITGDFQVGMAGGQFTFAETFESLDADVDIDFLTDDLEGNVIGGPGVATIPESSTITFTGLSGSWIDPVRNSGDIVADGVGRLEIGNNTFQGITDKSFVNTGVIVSRNGATLAVTRPLFNEDETGSPGALAADSNSTILIQSEITGGIFEQGGTRAAGSGFLVTGGALRDVWSSADITVANGAGLNVFNTLINDGTLRLMEQATLSPVDDLLTDTVISGNGLITGGPDSRIGSSLGREFFTLESGTIRGSMQFDTNLINHGTLISNGDEPMHFSEFLSDPSEANLSNTGRVLISGAGGITARDDVRQLSGSFEVKQDSGIGSQRLIVEGGLVENQGSIADQLRLTGGELKTAGGRLTEELLISGRGRLSFSGPPTSAEVAKQLRALGTGTIALRLGGTTPGVDSDLMEIGTEGFFNPSQLGGWLEINLQPGFVPQIGETFEIVRAFDETEGMFRAALNASEEPIGYEILNNTRGTATIVTLEAVPGLPNTMFVDGFE